MPGVGLPDEANRRLAARARGAFVALVLIALALAARAQPAPGAGAGAEAGTAAAQPPVPVILLLNSYSGAATSSWAQGNAIRGRLGAPGPGPEVWTASLDVGVVSTGHDWAEMSELLRRRYGDGRVSLVMTVDTPAFRFMVEHGRRAFPGVPWIFSAARDVPADIQATYPGCTGVEESLAAGETLDLIERLLPRVKRLLVLVEEDQTTRFQMDAVRRATALKPRPLELEWLIDTPWPALARRLHAANPDEAVLYLSYFNKGPLVGKTDESYAMFRSAYAGPWFTLYESQVGYGAVGGVVVSASAYGDAAAGLAARVLAGEAPSSIPVVRAGVNRPVFDVRALDESGIDAALLPAGSVLKHAQPGFLERHRTAILVGSAVAVAQGLAIALLIRSHVRRREALRKLARGRDRYQTLVDGAGAVLWEADAASLDFTFVSGHAERILGFPRQRWLDRGFRLSRVHPEDRHRAADFYKQDPRDRGDHEIEYRMLRADGAPVWVRDYVSPVGPPGAPLMLRGVLVDATADHRAQELAADQEHRLRAMASHVPGVIYRMMMTADEICHPLFYSPGFESIFGKAPSLAPAPLAERLELYHPDDRRAMADAIRQSARALSPLDVVMRIADPNGATRWLHLKSTPRPCDDGATMWDGVILDITERKAAEEQLRRTSRLHRLLLDELDHRVKNSLGGLLALVDLSAGHPSSVQEFAATLRARIGAMSGVHGLLSDAHWSDVCLQRLIAAMTPPHPRGAISISGPDVRVPARQATAMGMLVQELMTNSLKHGALGADGGAVEVAWTLEVDPPAQRTTVRLTWIERGGPPITEPPRARVGTGLMTGFAQFELAGSARLTYPREGARHEIIVRLDQAGAAGAAGPGIRDEAGAHDATSPSGAQG